MLKCHPAKMQEMEHDWSCSTRVKMANRRCLGFLARHCLLYPSSKTPIRAPSLPPLLENPPLTFPIRPRELERFDRLRFKAVRGFSSTTNVSSNEEEGELVSDDEEVSVSNDIPDRKRLIKEEAAAEVGYRVVGPLDPSEHPFNPYEPVFAVVQLILNKALMLGSRTQTIIGRPILPDTAIHIVVEEHALDAKVIIFKKKRRKNCRRTKGHRQELTKLRITNIQGIDNPQNVAIAA